MKLLRSTISLPDSAGRGKDGLLDAVRDVLQYSVNTWDQGFLDKLYSSTNAVSFLIFFLVMLRLCFRSHLCMDGKVLSYNIAMVKTALLDGMG